MHIHYITIFPEMFTSFIETSIIAKAQAKKLITLTCHNPRDYTTDKHHKVDDTVYGGGQGMLLMAQPMIDCLRDIILTHTLETKKRAIIQPSPSETIFSQQLSHDYAEYDNVIFVCGRYEGIDHRFQLWCEQQYLQNYKKISLGQFVTLGGEMVSTVMTEAITRLIPGVIKEESSRRDESYSVEHNMENIEYPQYTRPQIVEGYDIPEILLSGHHVNIQQWKEDMMG